MTEGAAWVIYCDGSAMPNPGRMGIGALLAAPDGACYSLSEALAGHGCNNEAELRALLAALRAARERGASAVRVNCDSSILVEQLGGGRVKPITRLAALFDEARALLGSFESASLTWIPGHRNGPADALARAALGASPRPAAKPRKRRR